MDYLTAWREGHEAGMQLSLKIINELTGHDFQKSSEVVLYIKQLEGDPNFDIAKEEPAPQTVEPKTNENVLMNRLANKIAMRNLLWS